MARPSRLTRTSRYDDHARTASIERALSAPSSSSSETCHRLIGGRVNVEELIQSRDLKHFENLRIDVA
jgi:hypothetical protein